MHNLFDKRFIIGFIAFIGLGLGCWFYLANTQVNLPERAPTFDELMALADKDLAKNDLINSYIYSQKDGAGFQKIMARAETGETKTQLMACYLLISGTGVEENDTLGYSLCEKAAKKGSIPAKVNLIYSDFNSDPKNMNWQETYDKFMGLMNSDPGGAHRGLQFLYRQDHPKASKRKMFHHLEESIKHENTNAMLALSEYDLRVYPIIYRNPRRAEKNLRHAYSLNDFDAGYTLALEYRDGKILAKNLPEYESMIKRMAAFLHPKSMSELAYMHRTGKGAEYDLETSNALFAKAAAFGNPYSQEVIGYHFLSGPVETRDYATGVKYLEPHAKNGNVSAMTALANYYAKPEIKDPKNQQIVWLAQAAMNGDEGAQETLGFGMMETGYIEEVQPYIRLLETVAKSGNVDASFLLARHYRAASGVKRDLVKAQSILNKVAHKENPRVAEEIDVIQGYIAHFGGIDAVPDIIKL